MKATELRIGNYLGKDGIFVTIDGRSIFDIWSYGLQELFYTPIPLNENWLLKLGANKFNPIHKILPESFNFPVDKRTKIIVSICNDKGKGEYYLFFEQDKELVTITRNLQYVHTFQNLYFALTGKELEVKEMA